MLKMEDVTHNNFIWLLQQVFILYFSLTKTGTKVVQNWYLVVTKNK